MLIQLNTLEQNKLIKIKRKIKRKIKKKKKVKIKIKMLTLPHGLIIALTPKTNFQN